MNYRLLVAGVSKQVVQLLGSAKNWPTREPCFVPLRKIPVINAVNLFMGVNEMRV